MDNLEMGKAFSQLPRCWTFTADQADAIARDQQPGKQLGDEVTACSYLEVDAAKTRETAQNATVANAFVRIYVALPDLVRRLRKSYDVVDIGSHDISVRARARPLTDPACNVFCGCRFEAQSEEFDSVTHVENDLHSASASSKQD